MRQRTLPTRDYSTGPTPLDRFTRGFPAKGRTRGKFKGTATRMGKRFAEKLGKGRE